MEDGLGVIRGWRKNQVLLEDGGQIGCYWSIEDKLGFIRGWRIN